MALEFQEVSKGASLWRGALESLVAHNDRCIPEEPRSMQPRSWSSKDRSTIAPISQEGVPTLVFRSLDNPQSGAIWAKLSV
jgi:hypothetical protein